MVSWKLARRAALAVIVLAVALFWVSGQGISASAADKAVATSSASTAAPSTDATPAGSPQAPGQVKKQAQSCVVNGKTLNPCPPGMLKQALRQAARQNAGKQQTGVSVQIAGVSPATSSLSPLAQVGTGPVALATPLTNFGPPDYFGVGNWANSPLPIVTNGVVSGGIQKFVDPLATIPIATPDTTTFPGSDYYQIGLKEYTHVFSSLMPAANIRGYYDKSGIAPVSYLGPLIVAARNRPVRFLFSNELTTDLNIPMDSTYMGAGMVTDGGANALASSPKRATIHLHGGNTPWFSDGTPHTWITPANGDGQPNVAGFSKGLSFMNVPDMAGVIPGGGTSLQDGYATYYYTNQQSGRLLFYHDHAYGTTRLNVYAGEAAGYLIADPAQESALASWGVPGTVVKDPTTGAITAADLTHMYPLVIQDRTFVADAGGAGSQMAAQDPTWDFAAWGGFGSLWFPHVYSPNQNPADLSGANGFGRYDWGPWFWPPQQPASLLLPAYTCTSAATPAAGWAFPPLMCPGVPDPSRPAPANSPASTPEAFMDTPIVNGVAYPNLVVAPAAYRFQILNAANDRTWNLGLYVAEPVTLSPIITNPGANYTAPVVTLGGCTGGAAVAQLGSGTFGGVAYTNGIVGITIVTQPSACTAPTITVADTAPGVGAGAAVSTVMSTNTDVHMVPALPAMGGRALPNCALTPALSMGGGGQITTTLTTPTGLPAGCWPLYTSAQGYTAGTFGENGNGTLSWGNSDARAGGVPDPLTAGPPIIQIGAEGGLLPQVAVIPSTPVSYDYNKRSITVLNVLNHGLLLGGAERADVIVDFSAFAGQTLILYNDAPAPVPAGDPRLDYYTNGPDQSASGGAPSTLAGYGPNTRTIMRIQVTGSNPNTTAFNLATLQANLPGLFATTQDAVIVPESVYPAANGNGPNTYLPIQATSISAWVGGPVGSISLTSGGAGYTAAPTVTIAPPTTGTAATATAALAPTSVASVALTNGGANYTSVPTVTIGGDGTGAKATATLSTTSVLSATVTKQGSGYSSIPTVTFSAPPTGTTATGTAVVSNRKVVSITITNPGSGYVIGAAPTVLISGGGGSGATATATLKGTSVASVALTAGGSGYTFATVSFSGGGGANAAATATITPTVVASVTLTSGGSGYTGAPAVTFSAPQTAGTTATAVAGAPTTPLLPKAIQELFTLDYGRMNATLGVEVPFTNFLTQTTIPYGFVDPPTEIFKDGETQLWKITHNGVDSHFMHFHLFTVQVINRIGWDGAIKPPDPNEVGLKDTVRMNPLEDVVVALRPYKQTLPFPVPSSHRLMDPTKGAGFTSTTEFTNVDPNNNPATVTNTKINFGWEYVWHCHILGHEENDMMRAMILAVAPQTPTATVVTGATKGTTTVTIAGVANTANVADPTGFSIYRATSAAGPFTLVGSVPAVLAGTVASATFTDSGLSSKTVYYYQVVANNLVGYTQVYATGGYPTASADSAPSVTVSAAAR